MKIQLLDLGSWSFSLLGVCPHCSHDSVFMQVGSPFSHQVAPQGQFRHEMREIVTAMQCQGCLEFILGVVLFNQTMRRVDGVEHYPIGKPDDSVSEDVPENIRNDFSEALRCRWVDAYNATVEMCRRALESSCLQLGAPEKLGTLQKMIDWVAEQGKITKPLQEMAHKVRLGGDRGAHPSSRVMSDEDADAVIEFTREYFDAIYVMPAKMAKFNFDRPKT